MQAIPRKNKAIGGYAGVRVYLDRHKKPRYRIRRKIKGRRIDHTFKSEFGSDAFKLEYDSVMGGHTFEPIGSSRTVPGTIDALTTLFYKSPQYLGLSDGTKATYSGILERFRREFGTESVAGMQRKHVQAIIASRANTPSAANNLLRMIKLLMSLALELDMRPDDPTVGVRKFKIRTKGFHTWTESEISQFEAHHPIGSKARLAFSLMLYLAQRRSDVVRLGWQHVRSGMITLRQQKTGAKLSIPIHQKLAAVLDKTPKTDMTFLITKWGQPHTAKGFGNTMRDWCDKAGLPLCASHGLRKAASRRMAEAGCTSKQIMAVTGHKSLHEVQKYIDAADQIILAGQAGDKLTNL